MASTDDSTHLSSGKEKPAEPETGSISPADAEAVAARILDGFRHYRSRFKSVTRGARRRFAEHRWQEVQQAARERILLYKICKQYVCEQLALHGLAETDWREVRHHYAEMVRLLPDAALSGTFYNTIYRAMNHRQQLDDEHAFVSESPESSVLSGETFTSRHVLEPGDGGVAGLLKKVLVATELSADLVDLDSDCGEAAQRLIADIPLLRTETDVQLEMIDPIFYRNKGAYLIGRLLIGEHTFPLALALDNTADTAVDSGQIRLDAILWGENRLSVVFSFTRAYFMVDIDEPSQLVDYLQRLLPAKKRSELYTSMGFYKHGKTTFVRGYRRHLAQSSDPFVIAEGIPGQVMMVFALPSYQIVFKVMKDRFPATKSVNHDDVRAAYRLVKTHDRVGRMADTQEFHFFEFPLNRFEPALLERLKEVAGESLEIHGDTLIIRHLWAERMMTPLNLYLQSCSDFQRQQVIQDYGAAVRELAAADIFPGDMLLKNFGVTRHGRVVFYDYDEICYLTDVNFRQLPSNANDTGAWHTGEFDVGEYDVFPEEFATFLFPDENIRALFVESHGDLFTPEGWQRIQEQVETEQLMDVYPYPSRARLHLESDSL